MKTRTFKLILSAVILMQIAMGAVLAIGQMPQKNDEAGLLLHLERDLLEYHAVLGDYELMVASSTPIDDTSSFMAVREKVHDDVSKLIEYNKGRAERIEVYEDIQKRFDDGDKVLNVLKDNSNDRGAGDRFALLVVMLNGMRRLDKISHRIHSDVAQMIETMPAQKNSADPLSIAGLALCLISACAAAYLMFRGPTSY